MIELNLPTYPYRLRRNTDGNIAIWDATRRRYVVLTPEEWVRQHFVAFLVLDHTLSNLAILEELSVCGVYARITDGKNRVRYLNATSLLVAKSGFRYLSLLAATERAKGVSVEGCRYPLKNATLLRSRQYAVSNEITGNCALVSLKRGALYVIESNDS